MVKISGGDGAKDACQGDSGGPLVVKVWLGPQKCLNWFSAPLLLSFPSGLEWYPTTGGGGQLWHWLWKSVGDSIYFLLPNSKIIFALFFQLLTVAATDQESFQG